MSKHASSARRYPRNSPHAAARIVALALIANGKITTSELAVLESMRAHEQLGITRQQWHDVVDELCFDLLEEAAPCRDCHVGSATIESLLDEVIDVPLQRLVLRLCAAVINADGDIDEGESVVLRTAIDRWGLHPDEQELLEPLLYGLDFQVQPRRAQLD